jgi:hypothetical protein
VEVAQLMFTGPKLIYLLSLLVPLAFLPLFAPKPLVLCLPIVALNLLALRGSQYDYESHYSLLMIPGLMAATVYGAANLRALLARRTLRLRSGQADEGRRTITGSQPAASSHRPIVYASLALIVWALVMTVPYKNPVARTFVSTEPPQRVRAGNELIALVPKEARVAASSKLAPRLLPRRYIYNFPPAPYSPYNFGPRTREDYAELDYVLVDPQASALREKENMLEGKTGLEWLESLPEWSLVEEREGMRLYRRVAGSQ